jgi:hypothetical protein
VTETTTPETTPHEPAEAAPPPKQAPQGGTPAWVWVVYVLGVLAATVFAASLAFVLIAHLTAGDGGAGVHFSTPALVVWLALAVAAVGTFVGRRWGGRR